MDTGIEPHKVLIIAVQSWARDTMSVFLTSMGCQCVLASSATQALALLEHENPGVAIFEPQAEDALSAKLNGEVERIIARLRGRVIVITNDAIEPDLGDLIRRYSLPHIPRARMLRELWSTLESLLRPHSVLQRVTHIARLVFDSFLQPLPAGIRFTGQTVRRFVYQCGSLTADISFEQQTDSQRMALVGQVLDSTNPDRRLEGISAVLRGRKGPIALAMTSEFGEFRFDFDFEPNVTIELEIAKNHWTTLVSPSLEWVGKTTSARA